jgi:hypothetical protein
MLQLTGPDPELQQELSDDAGFTTEQADQHGHLHHFLIQIDGVAKAICNMKNLAKYAFIEGEERVYPSGIGGNDKNNIKHFTFNGNHFIYLPTVQNCKSIHINTQYKT